MAFKSHYLIIQHLAKDASLSAAVGGRLVVYPEMGYMSDNLPSPYIVVKREACNNVRQTKDDGNEGRLDVDTVSVLVVASDDLQLCNVAGMVRNCLASIDLPYTDGSVGLTLDGYTVSDDGNNYDPDTGKMHTTLRFVCDMIIN